MIQGMIALCYMNTVWTRCGYNNVTIYKKKRPNEVISRLEKSVDVPLIVYEHE